jgi:hypothetical protein
VGKTYSKPSSGHVGGKRPGQTWKKPKDLSPCDREEGGCGEGGVCMVCVFVSEEREHGLGAGGHPDIILSECAAGRSVLR